MTNISPPRTPKRDSRRISMASSRFSSAVSSSDDSSDDELIYMDDAGIDALIQTPKSHTDSLSQDDFVADGVVWDKAYLSIDEMKTIQAEEDYRNTALGVSFGVSGVVGDRPYMEDRAYGVHEILSDKEYGSMSLFAVFDGHNGEYVAETLMQQFHEHLVFNLTSSGDGDDDDDDGASTLSPLPAESKMSLALRSTCHDMDMQILQSDYLRQLEHQRKGTLFAQKYAGAVGVVLTIFQSQNKIRCALANVGDCRAVLCDSSGTPHSLTIDHKPYLPEEKSRIEESGGFVNKNRVNGILAVSRSFGDLPYKLSTTSDDSKGELRLQRQVISEPQIVEFDVEDQHQFILLASDGIWEVMDNQTAIDCVRKQLAIHRDVHIAANKLTQKALADGSLDNISAIICMLNQVE
jgi:serine/threonine protein phosphatase PrpC